MAQANVVNQYFKQFEKGCQCKKTDQITGFKYNFSGQEGEGEIFSYFVDNHLHASLSKVKSGKNHLFQYIEDSDLIIIGFCLKGQKVIDYKGKHQIEKGDVVYFRPTDDFELQLSKHSFLYYYIDCTSFQDSLESRNCDDLFCDFHIDYICNKGDIHVKKATDIIRTHMSEIREIKKVTTNNFFDYAKMKGQLLTYLTWLIGLKLNENPDFKQGNCQRHYVSKAKKIILNHLEDHITVTEIASRLDISTYKLQKYFKELEGTTVYDFILKVKIQNSKVFLKQSNCPIIDIAQKVGYENPSKFSTTFKNITGYTPTEYRNLA